MNVDSFFFDAHRFGFVDRTGPTARWSRGEQEVGFFVDLVDNERERDWSAELGSNSLIDLGSDLFAPVPMDRVGKAELSGVSGAVHEMASTETGPHSAGHGLE